MLGGKDPADAQRELQQQELDERAEQELERAVTNRGVSDGPAVDVLRDMEPEELLDRLTKTDVESEEYDELVAILKPFLSSSEMLASHDEDYYDDRSRRLLNENLADRVVRGREYPDLCDGVFREIAQDINGDSFPGVRNDWSDAEKEAIRTVLADVRTDRQSLGDGTFFEGLTEMHVSHERLGESKSNSSKSGGLRSLLPW
ncbi:hypothetical protein SAMN04487947_0440 [Halogeometricum rufum]|uniref:Uncharacterized protein n=1 Tax=Halogeometricum rufum TaxID=553469 RepID=A0A1I6G231_9EURY|nr:MULTISPECIES: hypothetical protein [Halogeometricum]MUV57229.1 hypothetical protein [Halogeometricum sp. CBA1124]SFR36265.1 hypothetical protein SAMN04487947_0440 [Halogeometricum rufum]